MLLFSPSYRPGQVEASQRILTLHQRVKNHRSKIQQESTTSFTSYAVSFGGNIWGNFFHSSAWYRMSTAQCLFASKPWCVLFKEVLRAPYLRFIARFTFPLGLPFSIPSLPPFYMFLLLSIPYDFSHGLMKWPHTQKKNTELVSWVSVSVFLSSLFLAFVGANEQRSVRWLLFSKEKQDVTMLQMETRSLSIWLQCSWDMRTFEIKVFGGWSYGLEVQNPDSSSWGPGFDVHHPCGNS